MPTAWAGIVVNFMVRLEGKGLNPVKAALERAGLRLRPVIMGTLTTVLALLPSAVGLGEGAELQAPLARSVIDGLLFSTVVTLVLVPVAYATIRGRRLVRFAAGGIGKAAVVAGAGEERGQWR
jgi:HAE1 family hydrophobic/amphiphilic exporter-1